MATLTLQVTDYEKQAVKEIAAAEGKSMKSLFLESIGIRKRGTIHEAMQDIEEGNILSYSSVDELIADMKTW